LVARLNGVQKVVSSNLTAPTIFSCNGLCEATFSLATSADDMFTRIQGVFGTESSVALPRLRVTMFRPARTTVAAALFKCPPRSPADRGRR